MRVQRIGLLLVLLTLFPLAISPGYGQESGDSAARQLFLSGRQSSVVGGFGGAKGAPGEPPARPAAPAAPKPTNLGLGYTLLLRVDRDNFVHASSKRIFKNGEAIRLLVESSSDGYLYVFHKDGGGPARMIFPSWKVEQGKNRILAHIPLPVPAGAELVFGDNPGTETLTLLVLLRPIEGLPTGEGLRGKNNITIPDELFQRLSKPTQLRKDERVPEGTPANDDGKSGRSPGIKLRTYDEAPDYIVLNHDPIETRLVVAVQVTHK